MTPSRPTPRPSAQTVRSVGGFLSLTSTTIRSRTRSVSPTSTSGRTYPGCRKARHRGLAAEALHQDHPVFRSAGPSSRRSWPASSRPARATWRPLGPDLDPGFPVPLGSGTGLRVVRTRSSATASCPPAPSSTSSAASLAPLPRHGSWVDSGRHGGDGAERGRGGQHARGRSRTRSQSTAGLPSAPIFDPLGCTTCAAAYIAVDDEIVSFAFGPDLPVLYGVTRGRLGTVSARAAGLSPIKSRRPRSAVGPMVCRASRTRP